MISARWFPLKEEIQQVDCRDDGRQQVPRYSPLSASCFYLHDLKS